MATDTNATLLGLSILAAGPAPSSVIVGAALFFAYLLPFVIGASQPVISSKVAHAVQGRMFAPRVLLITTSFTVAYLTAGPLADTIFEPLLAAGGPLAASIGSLIGVGPGRGIDLGDAALLYCYCHGKRESGAERPGARSLARRD